MWNWSLYLFLLSLYGLVENVSGLSDIGPLVHSKVGLIRGLRATDGNYSMFLGIPYATVNESKPFGVSTPHPGFNELFEANDDSAICPQMEEFNHTIVGTLDCLHINIYVPNSASSRNQLPVLVYIFGGKFMVGFAGRYLYGPRYLAKQDIIFVNFNYRLGPYGFMCLDTPDVPGNQGLKDQRLAFKWIKDNIESFGGDSSKITIIGNSSGGSSVDYHLLYSEEKLFDNVIMQSGTALYPWAMMEPDKTVPLKLSEHLGFLATNTKDALAFLSAVNSNLLIASTSELGLNFGPCVEKNFYHAERFIYDHPVNIKKPHLENVSILLGYNNKEALTTYDVMAPEDYATLNVFYDSMEHFFNFNAEELIEMEKRIKHFYIGDEKISIQVKQEIIKFVSDFYYNYPVSRTIQRYLNNGAKNVYSYLFAYSGKLNFVKTRYNITDKGASHADEIGYLFEISYMDKNLTPEDELIINRITTLWANFVKFGNPTPEPTELLPVQWPAVTQDFQYYLRIDSELKVRKRNFKARLAFWDLFYRLNEKAEVGYQDSMNQFTCAAVSKRIIFLNYCIGMYD